MSGFAVEAVAGENIPFSAKGGQIWITYGAADGVGRISAINQSTAGVPGSSEIYDYFGRDLDLGNVNGDAYLDLVVGAPYEDIDGIPDAGSVVVLYGSAAGVSGAGARSFHQGSANVPGANEDWDTFGRDVKLDDVTGDGRADLVVSSDENGNGSVVYLPATGGRITAAGSRSISPTSVGVSTTDFPGFGWTFAD